MKLFVSQAIASIISSLFLIAGSSVLLISINWRLALAVLGVVPFIAIHISWCCAKSARFSGKRRKRSTG